MGGARIFAHIETILERRPLQPHLMEGVSDNSARELTKKDHDALTRLVRQGGIVNLLGQLIVGRFRAPSELPLIYLCEPTA